MIVTGQHQKGEQLFSIFQLYYQQLNIIAFMTVPLISLWIHRKLHENLDSKFSSNLETRDYFHLIQQKFTANF